MTRSRTRLEWYPHVTNPLAIGALWIGVEGHYTIDWGDQTPSTDVPHWNTRPVVHVYPRGGKYLLTARSKLNRSVPATLDVVVRPEASPQATVRLLTGTTVELRLREWDAPLVHRVNWGDATEPEEFDLSQLAPQHVYPAGFGKPTITVTDVPAMRKLRLTGPEIPARPFEPVPRTTFRAEARGSVLGGVLELFGFPPGVTVELGPAGWRDWTPAGSVTVDNLGQARRYYELFRADAPWLDEWYSVYVRWTDPDTKRWQQLFQPVQWCEFAGGPAADTTRKGPCWQPVSGGTGHPRIPCNEFALLVDWELASPQIITLSAAPAPAGKWSVDWGDGAVEVVEVTDRGLHATHDYGAIKPVWITVTNPAGLKAYRRLRQIEPRFKTWNDGSLVIFYAYEAHENTPDPCNRRDCDPYTVARVDAGDGRPLVERFRSSVFCPSTVGSGLSYAAPGTYTVTVYAPMSETRTGTHIQKTRSTRGQGEFDVSEDVAPNPLSQKFHVGAVDSPARYTAEFEITNSGEQPVPWQLEFTLDDPAVLAEAESSIGTATITNLGQGKWRITCDSPARSKDPFPVLITVEPCGSPRVWPTDVHLSVRQNS
jgi:hypothetical protein